MKQEENSFWLRVAPSTYRAAETQIELAKSSSFKNRAYTFLHLTGSFVGLPRIRSSAQYLYQLQQIKMNSSFSTTYSPVPLSEEISEDVCKDVKLNKVIGHDSCDKLHGLHHRTYLSAKLLLQLACFLFALSLILFFGAISAKPSDGECTKRLSLYSPALPFVEYEEHDFENYFAHPSKYRGPPTAELEDEWRKLWQYGYVGIARDDLVYINRSESTRKWQRLPEELGGGFAALIDVFHQLHCLNMIRQYTWGDYYERHKMATSLPEDSLVGNRMHVDHCIETLRLILMCHADMTPVLIEIDPSAPKGARADFNAHRKCRNFEKLKDWMDDNVVLELYPHDSHLAGLFGKVTHE